MATYTAVRVKHATLTANTVDTVTLDHQSQVEVANWGSSRIYVSVDGTTPTIAGDNCLVVGPGQSLTIDTSYNLSDFLQAKVTVRLVGTDAGDYSVTAF